MYAAGLANAREMDFGDDGTLFVGSMNAGKVYAITKDRRIITIDEGLEMVEKLKIKIPKNEAIYFLGTRR